MNTSSIKKAGLWLVLTLGSTTMFAQTLAFSDLADFSQNLIVNDSVMGGVSQSQLQAEDDYRRFSGNLSLANNGGFASVRFLLAEPLLPANKVSIRVKGDGREYQLRIRMAGSWQAIGYAVSFQTSKDQWQQFDFSVEDFKPVWRGRSLTNVPALSLAYAQVVSVFLADKQPGEFTLLLDTLTVTHAS